MKVSEVSITSIIEGIAYKTVFSPLGKGYWKMQIYRQDVLIGQRGPVSSSYVLWLAGHIMGDAVVHGHFISSDHLFCDKNCL